MERKAINEEDNEQDKWYEYARSEEMTVSALPEFVRHLTEDYSHDYGTICHACAAAAVAAATAVDHSEAGGITGFQAGAIMWQFLMKWLNETGPMRMLKYENMLYPQYRYTFRSIPQETWDWLQAQAKQKIAENGETCNPDVLEHWQEIARGIVPFGYTVAD